jgi:hypothetical protein
VRVTRYSDVTARTVVETSLWARPLAGTPSLPWERLTRFVVTVGSSSAPCVRMTCFELLTPRSVG